MQVRGGYGLAFSPTMCRILLEVTHVQGKLGGSVDINGVPSAHHLPW